MIDTTTYDSTKRSLSRFGYLCDVVIDLDDKIDRYTDQMTSCGVDGHTSYDGSNGSHRSVASARADAMHRRDRVVAAAINCCDDIMALISDLDDPYRSVLRHRYIDRWPMSKVADKMGYTPEEVYKIHAEGIKKIINN
jgi:DNA-directed RNA polymerase specialized sigma subunit